MNKLIVSSMVLLSAMQQVNAQNKGFKKLPSGLEYNMVVDAPSKTTAKEGSYITMHIRTIANDSSLFDSYKMNNNEPVPAQIQKPSFNGDVMEGLAMMSAGDSAIFRTTADSVFRGGQFPPFVKSGDKVNFYVKMISVQSKAEHDKAEMDAASKQNGIDDMMIQDYIKTNKLKAVKTASGLYYIMTNKGTGENAKPGQDVTMNYTGKLLDGTLFDSNIEPKFGHVSPFTFKLGAGQVIKGWDEGIALLNKGAKATLLIPSPLAYGSRSMPGNQNNPKGIPANSILIFDVEMVEAK
jgi:FKBP-type peptidyl-prolyl cis-trans isomerase